MSKARQQRLIEIIRGGTTGRFVERHGNASDSVGRRLRNGTSATADSSQSKKSVRAAAS
jgi:hypothetical protein